MPHTASAKKRMRQTEKRRLYNRKYKKDVKEAIKSLDAASKTGTADAEYKKAIRKLDKAAARGVIHPNKAARKKSQIDRARGAKKTVPAPAA